MIHSPPKFQLELNSECLCSLKNKNVRYSIYEKKWIVLIASNIPQHGITRIGQVSSTFDATNCSRNGTKVSEMSANYQKKS
mmetsp:Transcript_8735/g.11534  ORF Transcript_8735/g.11534 Transcript_8735/m.11534 type:complete len:81 (+) Transcript_8735:2890-3132(+)